MTTPDLPGRRALPTVEPQCAGVQHVALRSANLARSRAFYVEALGLPLLMESNEQFVVLAGQTSVGIHASTTLVSGEAPMEPTGVGLHHLSLRCEADVELARIAQALASRDIASSGVCTDELFGHRYVAFHDPDGVRWEVYVA